MHAIHRWARTATAALPLLAGSLLVSAAGPPASAASTAPAATLAAPTPRAAVASTVHIFYYPWYGSPAVAGSYRHWPQGGHTPPTDIGSNYFPVRGAYDSGDPALLDQHMVWLNQAGVGVAVVSWWGQGSYEDNLVPAILAAADRHGVKVAWHLEPYGGRTAASTVADISYINSRYGGSPAFYRDAAHGNRSAFYVFESLSVPDWTVLDQVRSTAIVLAQTTDTSKVAHFGGMYTYDGIAGATAPGWANASAFCKANGLVWSPSIAPGYVDDRAVPGNTTPTLNRDNGAAYDREWSNALGAGTGGPPTWVSITSFNEWHEGSQIEPASSTPPAGQGYLTYVGAYGTSGAAAETSYLDRTRFWVNQLVPGTPPPTSASISLRAHANGRFVSAGSGGASPLIANATAIGQPEQFDRIDLGNGSVALRARANGLLVTAENAGAAALIANRTAVGQWETFALIGNTDGSVSLRAAANGRLVTAENAGAAPLIANRTAVGAWEEFDLITS